MKGCGVRVKLRGRCGDMNHSFFSGKRVFITGHTGFKGSWLSIWLMKAGAEVTGYALEPPTDPSMFEICGIGNRIRSITGDIRNRDALEKALTEAGPEIVFHMAAQPLVRLSYDRPVETYETNVMGTVNLLDAIRRCSAVKAVVIVTSDKCYENRESFWGYRETDRLGGYDPYSNSKACQELVTSAYINSFFNTADYDRHGIAISTARAGNVIGGGDFALDRLVPDIIKSIISGSQLSIRNPRAVRPWQHVMEPLYGYMTLARKLYLEGPAYSGAWNFGPDDENIKTVDWIAQRLLRLFGKDGGYVQDNGSNPHETSCLKLDSTKARQLLGFSPRLDIDRALQLTTYWVNAFMDKKDMLSVTLDQIDEYEKIGSKV